MILLYSLFCSAISSEWLFGGEDLECGDGRGLGEQVSRLSQRRRHRAAGVCLQAHFRFEGVENPETSVVHLVRVPGHRAFFGISESARVHE